MLDPGSSALKKPGVVIKPCRGGAYRRRKGSVRRSRSGEGGKGVEGVGKGWGERERGSAEGGKKDRRGGQKEEKEGGGEGEGGVCRRGWGGGGEGKGKGGGGREQILEEGDGDKGWEG